MLKEIRQYPDNPKINPPSDDSWQLEVIDAPGAWLVYYESEKAGAGVAIIDTGINFSHQDLFGVDISADIMGDIDTDGHGTAAAGIIAARHDNDNDTGHGMAGVCPDVKLFIIKIVNVGGVVLTSAIVNALDFTHKMVTFYNSTRSEIPLAVDKGTPRVICLAWAFSCYFPTVSQGAEFLIKTFSADVVGKVLYKLKVGFPAQLTVESLAKVLTEVLAEVPVQVKVLAEFLAEGLAEFYFLEPTKKLLEAGTVVVLGPSNKAGVPAEWCVPSVLKKLLPGYNNLLIVSSSCGPKISLWEEDVDVVYDGQTGVDVWAPGGPQCVLGISSPTAYIKGTATSVNPTEGNSLAIPHVAGLAALLFKINPRLTAPQVCDIIRETAVTQDTKSGGVPVRVINAFAAALKVYNLALEGRSPGDFSWNILKNSLTAECPQPAPLAGYRLIIPKGFGDGKVELNEKYFVRIYEKKPQLPFCRFIAPKDLEIKARLLKPDETCVWEGTPQKILSDASPGSHKSAWVSEGCEELRTIRLQGLALGVCYSGCKGRVRNTTVRLKHRATGASYRAKTDNIGRLVIPFGEPGPYKMVVEEDLTEGSKYEVDLDLKENNIYTSDPAYPGKSCKVYAKESCIELGEPVSRDRWMSNWAGEVKFTGLAKIYKHGVGDYPFNSYYNGNLFQASGTVNFKATFEEITNEILFPHWRGEDDEGTLDTYKDYLPDVLKKRIRIFSELLSDVKTGFTDPLHNSSCRFQWNPSEEDWDDSLTLPAGFLLAAGGGEVELELNFVTLTRSLLDAHFRHPDKIGYPFTIDLIFCWYLDDTKRQGEGIEFRTSAERGFITPELVPCKVKGFLTEGRSQLRVVAGPSTSLLEFVKHPSSPLILKPDPEPCPPGCISAIVEADDIYRSSLPSEQCELYVLGSQGEIGKIDWY